MRFWLVPLILFSPLIGCNAGSQPTQIQLPVPPRLRLQLYSLASQPSSTTSTLAVGSLPVNVVVQTPPVITDLDIDHFVVTFRDDGYVEVKAAIIASGISKLQALGNPNGAWLARVLNGSSSDALWYDAPRLGVIRIGLFEPKAYERCFR